MNRNFVILVMRGGGHQDELIPLRKIIEGKNHAELVDRMRGYDFDTALFRNLGYFAALRMKFFVSDEAKIQYLEKLNARPRP